VRSRWHKCSSNPNPSPDRVAVSHAVLNKYEIITLPGFLLSDNGSLGLQQVVAFVVSVVIITEVLYRFYDTRLPPLQTSDAFAQGVTALALQFPIFALCFLVRKYS